MYADKITDSMQRTIDETERRRTKQMHYNETHGITPTQIVKNLLHSNLSHREATDEGGKETTVKQIYMGPVEGAFAADPIVERMTRQQLEKCIADTTKRMKEAAKNLDFLQAAQYRDEIIKLQKELELK